MVLLITCANCGFEYQSQVLQTLDEETLVSEPPGRYYVELSKMQQDLEP